MPRGSAQGSDWSRLAGALLLGAGLTAVGCVSDRVPRTEAESGAARADVVPASAARPIAGGPFEASGAARVPGTGGVLVVCDTGSYLTME